VIADGLRVSPRPPSRGSIKANSRRPFELNLSARLRSTGCSRNVALAKAALMHRITIESSSATIVVAVLVLVGLVLNAPCAMRLGADAGQAGRGNTNPEIPTLAYKLVEWPTSPTTAAGAPGAWNFIQVASVAVARQAGFWCSTAARIRSSSS